VQAAFSRVLPRTTLGFAVRGMNRNSFKMQAAFGGFGPFKSSLHP